MCMGLPDARLANGETTDSGELVLYSYDDPTTQPGMSGTPTLQHVLSHGIGPEVCALDTKRAHV